MTICINPRSMIRLSNNTLPLPLLPEIPDHQDSIPEHDLEKLLKLVDSNKNCKLKIGKNLYVKHKVEMDSKIESIFATANDDNIPKKLTKELLLKYFDHPILESNTHHIITKELQK